MPLISWKDYWERLKDEEKVFHSEAIEYSARLRRTVTLSECWTVLDFGCGFGYVGRVLAPYVKEIYLQDEAANMRHYARKNISMNANAKLIDIADEEEFSPNMNFDLILVNSVIQYMRTEDFSAWLSRWMGMLAPGGRIIVSDILAEHLRALPDIFSLIPFSARRGFLFQALKKGLKEMTWYFRMRRARPLRRYSLSELERIAAKANLEMFVLPENLTFRKGRISVILTAQKNT
jgi:SAM-dependent methyltransferase